MLHYVEICIYSIIEDTFMCLGIYHLLLYFTIFTTHTKSTNGVNNGLCIIICTLLMSAFVSFEKRPFILYVLIMADELQGSVEGPCPRLQAPHATYWAHCGEECVPFHGLNSPTKSMSIIQRQRVRHKSAATTPPTRPLRRPDHSADQTTVEIGPHFLLHLGEKPRPTILY